MWDGKTDRRSRSGNYTGPERRSSALAARALESLRHTRMSHEEWQALHRERMEELAFWKAAEYHE